MHFVINLPKYRHWYKSSQVCSRVFLKGNSIKSRSFRLGKLSFTMEFKLHPNIILYRQNILINKVFGPMPKSGPRSTVCYQYRMNSTYRPVSLAYKIMSPCPLPPCSPSSYSLCCFFLSVLFLLFSVYHALSLSLTAPLSE